MKPTRLEKALAHLDVADAVLTSLTNAKTGEALRGRRFEKEMASAALTTATGNVVEAYRRVAEVSFRRR